MESETPREELPASPQGRWKRRHLLGLRELEKEEILGLLDAADEVTRYLDSGRELLSLQGLTVVNLFIEPSTRTRVSFELAAKRLGASVLEIDQESSSIRKGETLKDTARNLEAMGADFLVLRHSAAGAAHFLADRVRSSVINAGDGAHEHPTQGLLDLLTIRRRLGKIEGVRVAIVGDILHSRVARSDIWGLRKLGAEIALVGPRTLLPEVFERFGARLSWELDPILPWAQVVILLRLQHERQKEGMFPSLGEYVSLYGLSDSRLRRCPPEVLLMHPGPIERGVEIESELADGPSSVILNQVASGVAVRMAVFAQLARFHRRNGEAR
ncbi:aspartate carbamoyltransferase catalytic subunit [Methylacidimicrobium cyclopophantes]|nr:aspartate carbamoyltransferase catalytic subunit [Methylacidimicrobium cyclopophantes]